LSKRKPRGGGRTASGEHSKKKSAEKVEPKGPTNIKDEVLNAAQTHA